MSASNKLIFSLEQNLTTDEKNRACKNIGAARSSYRQNMTGTHQVTQTEAQNGVIKFGMAMPDIQPNNCLTLFQVEIDVPASANLGQNIYPVQVELLLTNNNNGSAHETMATGVLCRTSNSSQWSFVTSFMFDFRRIGLEWTMLELDIDWGALTVPQSTEIIYSIARDTFK